MGLFFHNSYFLIETRSLPALARCYHRSFSFYVAHPSRSILTSSQDRQISEICFESNSLRSLRIDLMFLRASDVTIERFTDHVRDSFYAFSG
jgi:hypothetical protein